MGRPPVVTVFVCDGNIYVRFYFTCLLHVLSFFNNLLLLLLHLLRPAVQVLDSSLC